MLEMFFEVLILFTGIALGAYVMYAHFMFGNSKCLGTLLTIQMILDDNDLSLEEKLKLIRENVDKRLGGD